jgi:hypothetical protein
LTRKEGEEEKEGGECYLR